MVCFTWKKSYIIIIGSYVRGYVVMQKSGLKIYIL